VADKWENALSRGGLYFSEDEALYYFRQFVHAVSYCHANNVAHR
jgi:serine/threonine-protein kinase SRK2